MTNSQLTIYPCGMVAQWILLLPIHLSLLEQEKAENAGEYCCRVVLALLINNDTDMFNFGSKKTKLFQLKREFRLIETKNSGALSVLGAWAI